MAPFKSTGGFSVGKLLGVFRNRDLTLNSSVITNRYVPPPPPPTLEIATTNVDSINTSGSYRYATWITPGSFVASVVPGTIEYLLIGGGAEGAGQNSTGANGSPSTALGLTAYGGGGGGGYPGQRGRNGGSGGGGGGSAGLGGLGSRVTGTFVTPTNPAPVPFQGNDGGAAPTTYGGAGGGGAGAAGAPAPGNSTWMVGGIGKVAFSGDTDFPSSYGTVGPTSGRWFAAGGGGAGGTPAGAAPAQPVGGGGAGSNSIPGGAAVANTGSGGGGYAGPTGGGSAGAGAGGFLEGSMEISPGPYSITIGPGGTGGNGGDGAGGIFVLKVPTAVTIT